MPMLGGGCFDVQGIHQDGLQSGRHEHNVCGIVENISSFRRQEKSGLILPVDLRLGRIGKDYLLSFTMLRRSEALQMPVFVQ